MARESQSDKTAHAIELPTVCLAVPDVDARLSLSRLSRRQKSGNAGMTLIEVMIASGVMATALVLLIGSLMSISSTGALSEERSIADAHVTSILEEVSAADLDTLLAYQPPGFRGLRGEEVRIVCMDTSGTEVELPVDPAAAPPSVTNPVEVRVTVAWLSKAGHRNQRSISTFHRY